MAKRTQRSNLPSPPTDKAMQWQDMPLRSRRSVSAQMQMRGMAATGVEAQRTRLEASRDRPGNKAFTKMKAEQRLTSLSAIGQHLKNIPITLEGAANARAGLVMRGAERTRTEGTDPSHDWYFQHHRKLANVAYSTGYDKTRVIAASAVMSPQNNPEQELAAVGALARAHSNPDASITVSRAAGRKSRTLRDYAGKTMHPRDFTPEALAKLSEPGMREHITTQGVNFGDIAKGGTKGNVVRAINVLRGDVEPESAINPITAPKVWSYHNNIAKAAWGTQEHEEFTRRMRTATGLHRPGEVEGESGQMSFGNMFPGLQTATHGALDPTGHTAEDTWQQAISTQQQLRAVDVPGRSGRAAKQSPAKFSVGEGGQANQKLLRAPKGMKKTNPSSTMHAWQNKATQQAAEILSNQSGEIIPAMGVQAGGWTEARREAGKAIEEQPKPTKRKGRAPKQLSLF